MGSSHTLSATHWATGEGEDLIRRSSTEVWSDLCPSLPWTDSWGHVIFLGGLDGFLHVTGHLSVLCDRNGAGVTLVPVLRQVTPGLFQVQGKYPTIFSLGEEEQHGWLRTGQRGSQLCQLLTWDGGSSCYSRKFLRGQAGWAWLPRSKLLR